jgi:hypothetical protein
MVPRGSPRRYNTFTSRVLCVCVLMLQQQPRSVSVPALEVLKQPVSRHLYLSLSLSSGAEGTSAPCAML